MRALRAFGNRARDLDTSEKVILGALAVGGLLFFIAVAMGASALVALIVCMLWEYIAPQLDFVPATYHTLDFLTVWAGIVLIGIVRQVIFGR